MTNEERIRKQLKLVNKREQINTSNITELHSKIWGDFKNISGDVSRIYGEAKDIINILKGK